MSHKSSIRVCDKKTIDLFDSMNSRWPAERDAQDRDEAMFRAVVSERLGTGLGMLRLMLTIAREWTDRTAFTRLKQNRAAGKKSHLQEVMFRLLVRSCRITHEIVILMEQGFGEAAFARWRTLHEISIVSAFIAKNGEEAAKRYMLFQVVETFRDLKALERDRATLGFKPVAKRRAAKIRRDHAALIKRFGKKFGEECGWAADYLPLNLKENPSFTKLEQAVGKWFMRSHYKLATNGIHAGPKVAYSNTSKSDLELYLLGGSTSNLVEPGQNTAVTLADIVQLNIGKSRVRNDLATATILTHLMFEIPIALAKADRKMDREALRRRRGAGKPTVGEAFDSVSPSAVIA